jgi:hypothetical protein
VTFLPAGTEIPTTPSQFLKLEEGKHQIRVLDSAITGVEYWVEITGEDGSTKRQPKRVHVGESIPVGEIDPDNTPKNFWAFPIWNYKTSTIQTLSLTQKSLMKQLKTLVDDEDYGDPTGYDIVITRTGKTLGDTEYQLTPKPPKLLDEEVIKQYEELVDSGKYDINRLYDGEYPLKDK